MITIHTGTKKLIEALSILKPLTDTSGRLPILSNIRLKATASGSQGDYVVLWAADFETVLRLRIPARVTGPGTILLPCASLIGILKTFPKGQDVMIRQDRDSILIESGTYETRLPATDPSLYPESMGGQFPFRFAIDAPGMGRALDLTVPFSSKSEARKNLTGVHIVQDTGRATFTATDGHRLGRVLKEVDSVAAEKSETLIPQHALAVWRSALKWAGEKGKTVAVHYDDRQFVFMSESMVMTGRAVEGKFPDIDLMIPTGSSRSFEVDVTALAGAVAGVEAMCGEKLKPIKITLEPDQLTAESEWTEYGNAKQTIPVKTHGDLKVEGKPFAIGFNAVYLSDVLKCANGHAVVRVGFNGAFDVSVWTFPEEPGFKVIVMPLRIEW